MTVSSDTSSNASSSASSSSELQVLLVILLVTELCNPFAPRIILAIRSIGILSESLKFDISDLVVELNGDVAGTFGDDEIASPHAVVIGSFLSGVADTPVFS